MKKIIKILSIIFYSVSILFILTTWVDVASDIFGRERLIRALEENTDIQIILNDHLDRIEQNG